MLLFKAIFYCFQGSHGTKKPILCRYSWQSYFYSKQLSLAEVLFRSKLIKNSGLLKLQSHYSDNQSPTSDNHFFLGGCRRLSEVGKCLSMIADQSAIGCQRITSTTSRRPPTTTFLGVFFRRNSVVGK